MTFEEETAELAKLGSLAKTLGMSTTAFQRLATDAIYEAQNFSVPRSAAQTFAEIRRRIEPPGARKPGAP